MIMFSPLSDENTRSTARRSASSKSKLIGCPVYCFCPEPGTSVLKVGWACAGGVAGGVGGCAGGWVGGCCALCGDAVLRGACCGAGFAAAFAALTGGATRGPAAVGGAGD